MRLSERAVDRLIEEGLQPLAKLCRDARIPGSVWTWLRWAQTGRIEAVKLSSRWHSTPQAIRRFLRNSVRECKPAGGRHESCASPSRSSGSASKAAAGRYLESLGLGRESTEGGGGP